MLNSRWNTLEWPKFVKPGKLVLFHNSHFKSYAVTGMGSYSNSGWKGPQKVCRPKSSSKLGQAWGEAKLLRALQSWFLNIYTRAYILLGQPDPMPYWAYSGQFVFIRFSLHPALHPGFAWLCLPSSHHALLRRAWAHHLSTLCASVSRLLSFALLPKLCWKPSSATLPAQSLCSGPDHCGSSPPNSQEFIRFSGCQTWAQYPDVV